MLTGSLLWTARPLGTDPTEPIASGGTLYVDTTNDAGNRSAIRESDGTVLWDVNNHSVPVGDYDGGPVTLAGSHLVGYDTCGNGVGSNPLTGQINWIDIGDCSVASGMLGVTAGNLVWVGDIDAGQNWDMGSGAGNVAVNPSTGTIAGSFPAGTSPVFADGIGFQRREVVVGQTAWAAPCSEETWPHSTRPRAPPCGSSPAPPDPTTSPRCRWPPTVTSSPPPVEGMSGR
ncbi:MAG: hypothetical protein ACLQA5_11985 [Solirubrobacteraceae bacterium]